MRPSIPEIVKTTNVNVHYPKRQHESDSRSPVMVTHWSSFFLWNKAKMLSESDSNILATRCLFKLFHGHNVDLLGKFIISKALLVEEFPEFGKQKRYFMPFGGNIT